MTLTFLTTVNSTPRCRLLVSLHAFFSIPLLCPLTRPFLHPTGIDDILARHIAHLFIRDPIAVYGEKLQPLDEDDTDHFEVRSHFSNSYRLQVMGCSYNLTLAMEFIPPFTLSVNCLLVEMRYSAVLLLNINCRDICCAALNRFRVSIHDCSLNFPNHDSLPKPLWLTTTPI